MSIQTLPEWDCSARRSLVSSRLRTTQALRWKQSRDAPSARRVHRRRVRHLRRGRSYRNEVRAVVHSLENIVGGCSGHDSRLVGHGTLAAPNPLAWVETVVRGWRSRQRRGLNRFVCRPGRGLSLGSTRGGRRAKRGQGSVSGGTPLGSSAPHQLPMGRQCGTASAETYVADGPRVLARLPVGTYQSLLSVQ